MKCLIHNEADARATCRGCNRALCDQCATRFDVTSCEHCLLSHNRSVVRETYVGLIKTLIIFTGVTWFFVLQKDSGGLPALSLAGAALLGALFASTYWGWKFLTSYFPTLWSGTGLIWLIYLVFKFIAAYFTGLIVGPYQILKMLNQLRIVNRVKRQIASGQM